MQLFHRVPFRFLLLVSRLLARQRKEDRKGSEDNPATRGPQLFGHKNGDDQRVLPTCSTLTVDMLMSETRSRQRPLLKEGVQQGNEENAATRGPQRTGHNNQDDQQACYERKCPPQCLPPPHGAICACNVPLLTVGLMFGDGWLIACEPF